MKYAFVENGQVKDIRQSLPNVWNNISNFNVLDDETVKEFGWLKYTFVEGQTGDDYVILGSNFEVLENEVIEHQLTRIKTDEEKENDNQNRWKHIREERNTKLEKCDWTQLPDSPLTNQKQTEWQIYRQALRDITSQPDVFNLSWPNAPES
jgi:hypothetical protein